MINTAKSQLLESALAVEPIVLAREHVAVDENARSHRKHDDHDDQDQWKSGGDPTKQPADTVNVDEREWDKRAAQQST